MLRLMVSNDTKLNMTVAIIIVTVDLPRCMIDRATKSARSLNLPPCMISSCMGDSSRAKCVHMGKIFLSVCFHAVWIETRILDLYVQYLKIEIYLEILEIRGCDNLPAVYSGVLRTVALELCTQIKMFENRESGKLS